MFTFNNGKLLLLKENINVKVFDFKTKCIYIAGYQLFYLKIYIISSHTVIAISGFLIGILTILYSLQE